MPVEFRMPRLGEGVIEATVSRWLKQEGEPVEEGEPIVEVSTDKVDTEIPAPVDGVLLKILVPEGQTVPVDTVLALLGVEEEVGEGAPEPTAVPEAPAPVEAAATAPTAPVAAAPTTASAAPARWRPGRHPELGWISPLVAKLANEHGIDLRQVKGTGLHGRITKQDVLAFLEQRAAVPTAAPAPAAEAAPAVEAPTPAPPTPAAPPETLTVTAPEAGVTPKPITPLPGDELVPLTTMRRRIAEHMVYSKRVAPHATTVMEADLSRIVAHRNAHKEAFARQGVRLTYTAYFIAAAVRALQAYPIVNSSWTDQGLLMHKVVNIGVAVSLGEEGLIVPVIKNAQNLSLQGIAQALQDLAERARRGALQPDEITGSTFTITNHGVTGSLFATPIINQPNVAILGVGAIKKRVVVLEGDVLAIRPMVYLSLSFDHRVIDGAVADMFLARVVEILEGWGGEEA